MQLNSTQVLIHPDAIVNGSVVAGYQTTANTSTIYDVMFPTHLSSFTPLAGFGVGIRSKLKSDTTADRDAGRVVWKWETATDATRKSKIELSTFTTTTEYVGLSATKDNVSLLVDNLDKLQTTATTMTWSGQIIKTGVAGQYENIAPGWWRVWHS